MLFVPIGDTAIEQAGPKDLVSPGPLDQRTPAPVGNDPFGRWLCRTLLSSVTLLAISILGFLVTGYHPGAEDDGVYLTAIKADLNPAFFPHDSDFFKLELKETVFDTWMAAFVRGARFPLAWSALL